MGHDFRGGTSRGYESISFKGFRLARVAGHAGKPICTSLADSEPNPALFEERSAKARFGQIDAFLSHSWSDPPRAKWDALQAWRRDFVDAHEREPKVWIDKSPGRAAYHRGVFAATPRLGSCPRRRRGSGLVRGDAAAWVVSASTPRLGSHPRGLGRVRGDASARVPPGTVHRTRRFCIDQNDIGANLMCLPVFVSSCRRMIVLSGPTSRGRAKISRLATVFHLVAAASAAKPPPRNIYV